MFYHNLLIIFRVFKRYKTAFFINLAGLSAGLCCALLIYLWVTDEIAVDKFHENKDRIFQVLGNQVLANGIATDKSSTGMLEEALPKELPEIEMAVAIVPLYKSIQSTLTYEENNIKGGGLYAGKNFFRIFSFPLLQGDAEHVLAEKHNIVLSRKLALQLFKTTENIIGKTVSFQHDKKYMVAGVFEDMPPHSSFIVDFVLTFDEFKELSAWIMVWDNTGPYTYVLLKRGTDVPLLNKKLKGYLQTKNKDYKTSLFVSKFSDVYLHGNYQNGVQDGGRVEYVNLFTVAGIFILLIACANFMNLSTAKSAHRAKEIGVKKALGASRRSLVIQYLSESLLMAFLSLLAAMLLIALLMPQFNQITGKNLSLRFSSIQLASILIITIITGLVAGSYPAIYLSSFRPVRILKNNLSGSAIELFARKGLVIFQFTLSVIFIVCVLVVYNQMGYVQKKNIGFDRDNIICLEAEGGLHGLTGDLESFLYQVKSIPGVISASSMSHLIIGDHSSTTGIDWEGKLPGEQVSFQSLTVNYDFLEVIGVQMKEGRSYDKARRADSAKLILNEAAIRAMRLKDPVGKQINMWGTVSEILGVIKDFHFESLHENIKPVIVRLVPQDASIIYIKLQRGSETSAIAAIHSLYKKFNPDFSFDYHFLDEDYQAQYLAESRISILSEYFAGIAIFISCLGLFGLAAFTAEKRGKEISIRKVLGADNFSIVGLLSGGFTKVVLIAIALAIPLSYLLVQNWLEGFAYRIPMHPWYFIVAGLLALCIAWLTVALQAYKAARSKPVKTLRAE